jgi:site-specific recombinase XerD
MKTFIVLSLDTRRPKKDGTCPILLRISHYGKIAAITTGIYIKDTDWDDSARSIKSSYKGTESVTRLNNFLQKKKAEAIDIVTKLDERKVLDTLTAVQVKELIERKSESGSFLEFGESLAKEFAEANRLGNARSYRGTLSILKKFNRGRDVSFRDLTYSLLTKLEYDHIKKGNTLNGLAVYMRTIRAIYNEAIKRGLVEQELYPFKAYTIKTTKTRKRAISMDAIKRIQNKHIESKHPLFHARNYFLASFYLFGISFTDLAHLKVSNIIDGRIQYDRQKTDKPYNIKIVPEVQAIFDHYLPGKDKDDYIFPIIHRIVAEETYVEIQDARKRFNKKLKKLADLCEIQENLTSYVSRHSFATRAKNLGVPIASISDMLGHSSTSTTEVYLDTLPSDIIDDFHEKIIR